MELQGATAGHGQFPLVSLACLTSLPVVAYDLNMAQRRIHGPAVRVIRERTGIKHGIFAVQCDITPGYLTNIEKGHKQPSPAVAKAIADALGVELSDITYVVDEVA